MAARHQRLSPTSGTNKILTIMKKTVLITGATGYIGGHTALAFKELGYTVIGVDRQITISQSLTFLDEFLCMDFVEVVGSAVSIRSVPLIVHCAASHSVEHSVLNPGEYYDNNLAKTNRMLVMLAEKKWQGCVINSSSAAVYGMTQSPISESAVNISRPISPYGWSKLFVEQCLADHCRAQGFRNINLRYFNAAGCDHQGRMGAAQQGNHLFTTVTKAVCQESQEPFVINGGDYETKDGTCVRDYVHVSDIAQAHVSAVGVLENMLESQSRSYNIGSGTGYTVREVVDAVKLHSGFTDLKVTVGPRRAGDPESLVADHRRFTEDSNWRPVVSTLEDLASTTYNWFHDQYYS